MLAPHPQIVEYNEAVQHPATAFRDPELRQGKVRLNALGLPLALSGGFALTYTMTTARRKLAVRCFHREIPRAQHKYAAIARALGAIRSPYFVGFEYLPDGIRIRGGFYPVLKMEWAEGEPLDVWLERNRGDKRALAALREKFAALAAHLEAHGMAHGDIQNGNVIVSPAGLKLVDYDGVYVPGMPPEFGSETGHKHFQHPKRTPARFGPLVDRFSFIAVDLSLVALIEDPALFRRGGETIVFRAADFADPANSEAFRAVARHSSLGPALDNFAAICGADFDAVPSLADFRAGRNIPAAARPAHAGVSPARESAARPIVCADDFAAVGRHAGREIELVGRVQAVRRGTRGRGQHRGKTCAVLDFGPPRGGVVELIVPAASPAAPGEPEESWVGRWIAAVGLVDASAATRGFLFRRSRIGVDLAASHRASPISEEQARSRLRGGERPVAQAGQGGRPPPVPTVRRGGSNRRIVARLGGNPGTPPPAAAPIAAPAGRPPARAHAPGPLRPQRSNRDLMRHLRPRGGAPASAAAQAPRPPLASASRRAAAPPASPPAAPAPAPVPRSGSLVIHPRTLAAASRQQRGAAAIPAPDPEPTLWQRMKRRIGIDC